MTDRLNPSPWGSPVGPGPRYERVGIWLPQLAAEAIRAGDPVIRGRTFIECMFEGPAVMLPVGGCDFDACNMGVSGGDPRNLLLHPVGKQKVVGAIAFEACVFQRCHFHSVGFTGSPAFLGQFMRVIGGKGEGQGDAE